MTEVVLGILAALFVLFQIILAGAILLRAIRPAGIFRRQSGAMCGACRGRIEPPLPADCPTCSRPLHIVGILTPTLAINQRSGRVLPLIAWTFLIWLPAVLAASALDELRDQAAFIPAIIAAGVSVWALGAVLYIMHRQRLLCRVGAREGSRGGTRVLAAAAVLIILAGGSATIYLFRSASAPPPPPFPVAVHESVVLIEQFDASGKRRGNAVAFYAEPGHFITSRHCIEGASRARVRLPDGRRFPITGIVADGEDLDAIFLEAELPRGVLTALQWAEEDPSTGDSAWIVRRTTSGVLPGRRVEWIPAPVKGLGLCSLGLPDLRVSAVTRPGFSGSPIVDRSGRIIGVLSFGNDDGGNSSGPSLSALQQLSEGDAVPLDQWWSQQKRPAYREGLRHERKYTEAMRQGDTAAAIHHARNALRHDPQLMRTRATLSKLLRESGKLDEAADVTTGWIELRPQSAVAHWSAALIEEKRGDLELAAQHGRRAAALQPDGWTLATLGRILYSSARYDEAVEPVMRWLELQPESALAWSRLGRIEDRRERFEEALAAHRRALDLDPAASRWFQLGWTLQSLDRLDEALSAFQEGTALAPEESWGWHAQGRLHHHAARLEDALYCYRRAVETDIQSAGALHYWLGRVLFELGRLEEAEQSLRDCLAHQPDDHQCHCLLGEVLLRAGEFDAAAAHLTEALSLDQHAAEVLTALAICVLAQNDGAASNQWLARLEEVAPERLAEIKAFIATGKSWRQILDRLDPGCRPDP